MLINLTDSKMIFNRDESYLPPAHGNSDEGICGRYAPEWPYYRCTRAAGHEETDPVYPHTHAAHGNYRSGMFAMWQEEGEESEK